MSSAVVLNLLSFFSCFELVLLIKFILEHVIELLIIFGLTHESGAFFRAYITFDFVLFLFFAEGDPIGHQFKFILEFVSLLPQLTQSNRLQLIRKKQLAIW